MEISITSSAKCRCSSHEKRGPGAKVCTTQPLCSCGRKRCTRDRFTRARQHTRQPRCEECRCASLLLLFPTSPFLARCEQRASSKAMGKKSRGSRSPVGAASPSPSATDATPSPAPPSTPGGSSTPRATDPGGGAAPASPALTPTKSGVKQQQQHRHTQRQDTKQEGGAAPWPSFAPHAFPDELCLPESLGSAGAARCALNHPRRTLLPLRQPPDALAPRPRAQAARRVGAGHVHG